MAAIDVGAEAASKINLIDQWLVCGKGGRSPYDRASLVQEYIHYAVCLIVPQITHYYSVLVLCIMYTHI